MAVTIVVTSPGSDIEVVDVDVWDDGTGIRRDVNVTCETTPDDDENYADIVKGYVYADLTAAVPDEPPGGAEELFGFGGSTFSGFINNALCGKLWPLPQFKIAVWAGFNDPKDPGGINWVAKNTRNAYGHCVSYL